MSLRTAELSKEKSLASYNEPIISTPILVQGTAFSARFYLKSTKNTGSKKSSSKLLLKYMTVPSFSLIISALK